MGLCLVEVTESRCNAFKLKKKSTPAKNAMNLNVVFCVCESGEKPCPEDRSMHTIQSRSLLTHNV